jgi:ubiquinone/menaquinone biosynthesis C-methylase UbiE
MDKYLQSCKSDFWKEVFEEELYYILHQLKGAKDILSVGCGPAIIETGLAEHGFNITGLDISEVVLGQNPDSIRTVVGSAEKMNFADCSFDAVVYVASLQFIEKYERALKETFRVLRPKGKFLAMLLNSESDFFKEKTQKPDSYISRIKHINVKEITKVVAEYFSIKTEYFLGIKGARVFQSQDSNMAGLYVIKGIKKR